eukprot:TRINITY_DN1368_c0_g1_i3.p1 TRINITY_DN1368_c0_g1~~TRINITY_DN1368_c0_g1_i3.p1  ORF type:complete len:380 (-),score=70.13 TRINITY_DN1368_c0_g1_i3:220-1359(-)
MCIRDRPITWDTETWDTVAYAGSTLLQPWRGAGARTEEQVTVVDGEWIPAETSESCPDADQIDLNAPEFWSDQVKDMCGWDWSSPVEQASVRFRIGQRTHDQVFGFRRGAFGFELETGDDGVVLQAKVRDALNAPTGDLSLVYKRTVWPVHLNTSGDFVGFGANETVHERVDGSKSIPELLTAGHAINLTVCNVSHFSDNRLVNTSLCEERLLDSRCVDSTFVVCEKVLWCPNSCYNDDQCMVGAFCNQTATGAQGTCTVELDMCATWTGGRTTNLLESDRESCYKRSSLGWVCPHTQFLLKLDKWGMYQWALPLEQAAATAETFYWMTRAERFYAEADLSRVVKDAAVPDNRKRSGLIPGTNVTAPHVARPMHQLTSP